MSYMIYLTICADCVNRGYRKDKVKPPLTERRTDCDVSIVHLILLYSKYFYKKVRSFFLNYMNELDDSAKSRL